MSKKLSLVLKNWATSLSLFTFMHWRRKWQPTPVFLPGESCGQRSLVGCCLWGRTESDRLKWFGMHACVGEGNGNPLQCSCLENPVDRGAWWAIVHNVTKIRHSWADRHIHVCLGVGGVWWRKLSSYPLGYGHPRQINAQPASYRT